MTSQYFKPLTLQTLSLPAAAIHCARSEYASGKKATVMSSEDEDQGTFCRSPVMNLTPEATTLSITHWWAARYPPLRCNSDKIGTPQFPTALLRLDSRTSISFDTGFPRVLTPQFPLAHLCLDCCFYAEFPTPYTTPNSPSGAPPLVLVHLNPCRRTSAQIWRSFSFCASLTPSVYPSFPHRTPHLALLCSLVVAPCFIQIIIAFQMSIQIPS